MIRCGRGESLYEAMHDENHSKANDFTADGFVHIPDFLDEQSLRALRQEVERFLAEVLPNLPAEHVYRDDPDDPASLKQIQQLGLHDPWFEDLQTRGLLPSLATALLREPAAPRNLQYFDKPSRTSLATPAHQDGAYFGITPNHAVTLWIPLDDVEEEQGCVCYVPGSHRGGLQAHGPSGVLGFSRGILGGTRLEGEVPRPCLAGDLLAHHSLTIHRAGANRSPAGHRRALGLVYYGDSARVDEADEKAYQQALAGRLRAEGRI